MTRSEQLQQSKVLRPKEREGEFAGVARGDAVSRSYGFFISACGNPYTTERADRHALVSSSVPAVRTSARSPLTNSRTTPFLARNARRPRLREEARGEREARARSLHPRGPSSTTFALGPATTAVGSAGISFHPRRGDRSAGTRSSPRAPFLRAGDMYRLSASARIVVQRRWRGHVAGETCFHGTLAPSLPAFRTSARSPPATPPTTPCLAVPHADPISARPWMGAIQARFRRGRGLEEMMHRRVGSAGRMGNWRQNRLLLRFLIDDV
ncbi:hypothetical protein DFH09DRAFT_1421307 [Mycena vulgaris]|nr:hypothetical protein DFH09DRAFT_1421307 [Mycena vulgaris]